MKKLSVWFVVFITMTGVTYGQGISWSANSNWLNYANGTTRLAGSINSSDGCFVQLIWVGTNGVIDAAISSGTGVTADDAVVDKRWVGAGVGGANGFFGGGNILDGDPIISNRFYYARVWSAPAFNYTNGLVPTSASNKYGNSVTWRYPKSDPISDSFDITGTSDINTMFSPIPEPAVFGLGIIGLLSLRFFSRKRK